MMGQELRLIHHERICDGVDHILDPGTVLEIR